MSKIVVVGGCGHVGLPLAIALADKGAEVVSYDINQAVVEKVNAGSMPFIEPRGDEILRAVLKSGKFRATTSRESIRDAETIIVVVGTPVDEHLNPDPEAVPRAIHELVDLLDDSQLLVLRSTVYPGVTQLVSKRLAEQNKNLDIAFCPERIAEGYAFTELYELPQIVSGCTPRARERARNLFSLLTDEIVEVSPEEAELAKLFTNSWRYIKFAAANQFFMIANDFGLDFSRIRHAITHEYPRAKDLPGPGFAAGPCLFKDTMQLAAFNNNNYVIGHASMMVNEGLPLYLVSQLSKKVDLSQMSVGILGMAFKGESDDTRSSLAYKLKRILKFRAREVLCTDEYVSTDPSLVSLDQVLEKSDVLIIGAPHNAYRSIKTDKLLVDVWDLTGRGTSI